MRCEPSKRIAVYQPEEDAACLVSALRNRRPCLRSLPASLPKAPSRASPGCVFPALLASEDTRRSMTLVLTAQGGRLQARRGLWASPPAFREHTPHVPPVEPAAGSLGRKACTPALTRLWALYPRTQSSCPLESPQPPPSCTQLAGSALPSLTHTLSSRPVEAVLPRRELLAISRDIFGCHNGGRVGSTLPANRPAAHRTTPTTKNYQALNVNSVKVEDLCSGTAASSERGLVQDNPVAGRARMGASLPDLQAASCPATIVIIQPVM